ncbi:hypothetical protein [Dorea formicigenerans]|uniref:hypothetical protein n=1 Tax=Dorea formicigenerans TaxID=39486 RepID=UPI0032C17196
MTTKRTKIVYKNLYRKNQGKQGIQTELGEIFGFVCVAFFMQNMAEMTDSTVVS